MLDRSTSTTRTRHRPTLIAAGLTAVLALTLAGCSGSGSTSDQPTTQGAGGGQGGGRAPGVSGTIAAVSGKTLQVQSSSEQTAVTYTDATRFTELQAATSAALETGLCASVRTDAGTGGATPATAVTATEVTLSPAVDGECTGGAGGGQGGGPGGGPGGGQPPSGAPSDLPSGAAPSDAPSGGPNGGAGLGRGTNGKVTSVDVSTFVVAATQPGATTTTDVTVTTTSATTWRKLATSSAKAATVGRCAFATGSANGTGALYATAIRLSEPAADGTCAAGFGGRRGNGQGGNGQGGSGQGGSGQGGSGQGNG